MRLALAGYTHGVGLSRVPTNAVHLPAELALIATPHRHFFI